MPPTTALLRPAAVLLAVVATALLTGCVDQGAAPVLPTDTASPAATQTTEPTAEPTEDPVEPIEIGCADLVDPDAVYAFDPNYALLGSWVPAAGSAAAEAVAAGGVACQWVRESGSGTIDLSVARLDETDLVAKKNEAFAESQMVPTYGEEAYFEVEGGVGTAIVFQGPFWLVISSVGFAEPGEPTEIIDSALAALAAL